MKVPRLVTKFGDAGAVVLYVIRPRRDAKFLNEVSAVLQTTMKTKRDTQENWRIIEALAKRW
jgi:hypothetical protein